jgi:hypothetical protein
MQTGWSKLAFLIILFSLVSLGKLYAQDIKIIKPPPPINVLVIPAPVIVKPVPIVTIPAPVGVATPRSIPAIRKYQKAAPSRDTNLVQKQQHSPELHHEDTDKVHRQNKFK